jgi:protein SCO1/2
MTPIKAVRIALWSLIAAAGIGAALLATGMVPRQEPRVQSSGIADIGGPFQLTTHKGMPLTDADLRGRPYLVFFGFTYCPEICPTTLTELTARYEALGAEADKLTTLLVTVDPARDTQEALSQYMTAFHPSFVALRGTQEQTDAMVKTYRATARKVPTTGDDYTMDHTTVVYMMDRQGRFVGTLDPHEKAEVQLTKLRRLIKG